MVRNEGQMYYTEAFHHAFSQAARYEIRSVAHYSNILHSDLCDQSLRPYCINLFKRLQAVISRRNHCEEMRFQPWWMMCQTWDSVLHESSVHKEGLTMNMPTAVKTGLLSGAMAALTADLTVPCQVWGRGLEAAADWRPFWGGIMDDVRLCELYVGIQRNAVMNQKLSLWCRSLTRSMMYKRLRDKYQKAETVPHHLWFSFNAISSTVVFKQLPWSKAHRPRMSQVIGKVRRYDLRTLSLF